MVFFCFETKACIPHLLILDDKFITLDKNHLGIFKCEYKKKLSGFAQMSISIWRFVAILRLHWSNFDVNVIEDHLNLVEVKHTFRLDPLLLNLKVYGLTFIHLKVPTWLAENLKIQWWIRDKMLLSSLKKIECKHLMRVADLCKWGVSQLNSGDYSPRGGQKRHIHSFEGVHSINQNWQRRS